MKLIFATSLMLSLCSFNTFAQSPRIDRIGMINSFSIVRTGGGRFDVEFFKGRNMACPDCNSPKDIVVKLKSCDERTNTQTKTTVLLSTNHPSGKIALAILDNKAILASDLTPELDLIFGGTWQSLKINYTQNHMTKKEETIIDRPMIIMDGKVISSALSDLENIARDAFKDECK